MGVKFGLIPDLAPFLIMAIDVDWVLIGADWVSIEIGESTPLIA